MKKIILFTFLFIQSFVVAQSEYFEHTVSQGETLYQISRKYNVKIAQIYNLNPSTEGDLIKVDEVLRIPTNATSSASIPVQHEQDGDFIYHIVDSGETKFGLQRKYGVSISQLESDNPHIISMLQTGHRVKVRKSLAKYTGNENVVVASGSGSHTVVRGETLTSISRQYNIKLSDLVAVNRDNLGEFLQVGQRLVIPGEQQHQKMTGSAPVHIVQQGETKYGLSKRYNTSVEILERLNPHIVTMLKAGHTITLPVNTDAALVQVIEPEKTENNVVESVQKPVQTEINSEIKEEPKEEYIQQEIPEQVVENVGNVQKNINNLEYVDYEIQPKETLYGLARKANLSQSQLLELNPSLQNGALIGMIIKMPSHVQQSLAGGVAVADPSVTDLIKTIEKQQSKKLLFTLPFVSSEYENYKTTKQTNSANREALEFYSGALVAVDSIRKLGVDVRLDLIDTKSNAITNSYLEASKPDLIIGTYSQESEVLNVGIPFVYPFVNDLEIGSEEYLKAIPTKEFRVKNILNYLAGKKGNVIAVSDVGKTANKELISQIIPDVKFLTMNDRATPNENDLKSLLDKGSKNYVILDTDRAPLFLNVTTALLSESTDYNIQLVIIEDTPVIENQQVSSMRLRLLNTLYTSLYNQTENKNSYFHKNYFKQHGVLPNENAIRGFDVTFDVLLRSLQKETFMESVQNQITKQNRQKFEYQKTDEGKYQNKTMYLFYYDTDSDTKPVD